MNFVKTKPQDPTPKDPAPKTSSVINVGFASMWFMVPPGNTKTY